jgi:hypothetical protein
VQTVPSHASPGMASGMAPSTAEDNQGALPIDQKWQVSHNFLQTRILKSREVEDTHGRRMVLVRCIGYNPSFKEIKD